MVENTVRSIPARKNWQEKGEYGKLFTRISGQNTSGVGREGKFALESCGYEPCATAYHRTLSTPPVESTVTRCTTWIPPSMATTEIHGVDAVSRLLVRPRVARTKEEYGIRGYRRRRKMEGDKPLGTRRVQTVSSSSSSSREIPKKLSLGACWLVARSWPTESRVGMIFPNLRKVDRLISRKGIGDDCRAVLHELVK